MSDLSSLNFKKIASSTPIKVVLLNQKELDKGKKVELEHDGEKMQFEVYAQDSDQFRKIDLEESRKTADAEVDSTADRVVLIRESGKRKVAGCVVSGRVFYENKWHDIDSSNAMWLFNEGFDWIADQLWAAMKDRDRLVLDAKKN